MVLPRAHSEGVNVVVLGAFNPRIFDPLWFAQQNLAAEEEVREADAQFIEGFSHLPLPWATVTVYPDRLAAASTEGTVNPAQIRDLAGGILKLLPHTPARQMGVNRWAHYPVESEEVWHRFGHHLTPKEIWEEVLSEPGMLSIEIQGRRTDGNAGAVNVAVQPSRSVHPGVFINVNDDVRLDDELPEPAGRLGHVLRDSWEDTEGKAEEIMTTVIRQLEAL